MKTFNYHYMFKPQILFFFIIIFLLFSSACNKAKLEDVEALTNEEVFPAEIAKDIEFTFSDSGKVKGILLAPLMESYQGNAPYREMKKGLTVTFYNNNIPSSFLRANYGIQHINKKLIEVKGNVVVVNTNNDTLTTEQLFWNQRKAKVYSEKYVRVRRKNEIIKSQGFESDPEFKEYKFYDIRGVINLKETEEEK